MTIRIWGQPMRDFLSLREAMDRMFEDAVVRAPGEGRAQMTVPLEIGEHEDKLVVKAPVPGFEPDQIDISIQGDILTLRGSYTEEQERDEGEKYMSEWRVASFQRVVQLPSTVEGDKAKAHYKNGVLRIELPKVAAQVTRRIEVDVE